MSGNGKNRADMPRRRPDYFGNVFENSPFLRLALPLAMGIALGNAGRGCFSGHEPLFFVLAAIFAAFLAVMAFSRRAAVENIWFGIAQNLFFLFFGAFLFLRSEDSLKQDWPDSPVACEGVVSDRPHLYEKVTRMRVRLTSFYEAGEFHDISRTVELAAMRSPALDTLKTGDGVMFFAEVKTPVNPGNPYEPDYASNLLRAGVSGKAFAFNGKAKPLDFAETRRIIGRNLSFGERFSLMAKQIRDRLQEKYGQSGLTGDKLAVLSALTLGDKHLLSGSMRKLFSTSGVSHVLALSGLHLGIIYGILQFLFTAGGFARRARIPAQVLIIVMIWLYAFVAGMPSSLVRAAIMYSLVSLAVIMDRKAITLNNLFAAAFIMLLVAPLSLFDIGFQLSFISVFFILMFVRVITPAAVFRRPVAGKLWGMIAVSVCAQAGVAPLVAYYFNQFPVYFILSNLVAVPMAFLLVSGGLLCLAFSWLSPVASVLAQGLKLLLSLLFGVLDFIGGLPLASVAVYPSLCAVFMVYAAFFFAVLYFRGRNVAVLAVCMSCVVAAVTAETVGCLEKKDVAGVYFYKSVSCPAVHFVVSPDESYVYAPSRFSDSAVARSLAGVARNFWQRCGIEPPQRLLPKHSSPVVERNGCMVQFGRLRICLLDSVFPRNVNIPSIKADAIYVVRGFRGDIAPWLRQVSVERVVLDENLTDYRRKDIAGKCAAAGVGCYDMKVRKALKMYAE